MSEPPGLRPSRLEKPPVTLYYVVWGRRRMTNSHLYRQLGWVKKKAVLLVSKGYSVRVFQLQEPAWVEVHDVVDEDILAHLEDMRAWAGDDPYKQQLLEMPGAVDFIRGHPRLERGMNWVGARLARRREKRNAGTGGEQ